MTYLVERLADLRQYLEHLRALQPRVTTASALESDLSLRNDVLFSLLMVCQLVIDIAGELSGRHGLSYADYTEAVRNLRKVPGFSPGMVAALEKLPGFRNVLLHDYVAFSVERGLAALHEIDAIDEFVATVAGIEAGQGE